MRFQYSTTIKVLLSTTLLISAACSDTGSKTLATHGPGWDGDQGDCMEVCHEQFASTCWDDEKPAEDCDFDLAACVAQCKPEIPVDPCGCQVQLDECLAPIAPPKPCEECDLLWQQCDPENGSDNADCTQLVGECYAQCQQQDCSSENGESCQPPDYDPECGDGACDNTDTNDCPDGSNDCDGDGWSPGSEDEPKDNDCFIQYDACRQSCAPMDPPEETCETCVVDFGSCAASVNYDTNEMWVCLNGLMGCFESCSSTEPKPPFDPYPYICEECNIQVQECEDQTGTDGDLVDCIDDLDVCFNQCKEDGGEITPNSCEHVYLECRDLHGYEQDSEDGLHLCDHVFQECLESGAQY